MPTFVVTKPILSGPLLITNTSDELAPKNGSLNSWTKFVLPTSNLFAPFRLLIVIFCPFLKGWLGILIVLVGMETSVTLSPMNVSTLIAPPIVVPIPTDCLPLK